MNIVLPKRFYFEGVNRNNFAKVKAGKDELVVNGTLKFKDLMYALTYETYGTRKCYYCGERIKSNELTLDHMYPQDVGGPTIPSNLVPTCVKCNSEKANMTCEQYMQYLMLETPAERKSFRKEVNEFHELMRRQQRYELPEDWVTEIKLTTVVVEMFFEERIRGNKLNRIREFYDNYGYLQRPIIVNRRHYLFNGFTQLMFAREIGLKTIPAIVLENVKVIL